MFIKPNLAIKCSDNGSARFKFNLPSGDKIWQI